MRNFKSVTESSTHFVSMCKSVISGSTILLLSRISDTVIICARPRNIPSMLHISRRLRPRTLASMTRRKPFKNLQYIFQNSLHFPFTVKLLNNQNGVQADLY